MSGMAAADQYRDAPFDDEDPGNRQTFIAGEQWG